MKKFLLWGVCLLFFACTNSSTNDNQAENDLSQCKTGKPTPIFTHNMANIVKHSFQELPSQTTETVVWKSGLALELTQSGCKHIKQLFQFERPENKTATPEFWLQDAANCFKEMAATDEKTASLGMWANVIEQNLSQFHLGEAVEVEKGHFIKIDCMMGKLLVVTLSDTAS